MSKRKLKQLAGLITEAEYSFHIDLPENIYTLFKVFKKHGKKLFVVGGAVRDALLKKQPKDFDVVTDALPDEVEEILNSEKIYNFPSGKNFGIVSAVINDETFEIATFRSDNYSDDSDGRRPTSVTFGDIEGDAMRRDLTINALYYDIDRDVVIDLVGGVEDLKNKVIKPVGDAMDRFTEDRLRTLRALRFAHRFGSKLDKQTIDAIVHFKDLPGVSNERIRDEFYKALHSSQNPESFIEQFLSLGLGPRTFGKLSAGLDTRPVPGLRDPLLVLAKLLLYNTPNEITNSLQNFKASKDEVSAILFLKNIYDRFIDFDPLVFDPKIDGQWFSVLSKQKKYLFETGKLTPEQTMKWATIKQLDKHVISRFISFELPYSAQDFPDMKQGSELGQKINLENAKAFIKGL